MSLENQTEKPVQCGFVECSLGNVFHVHLINGYSANAVGLDMPLLIDQVLPEQMQILGQTSYNNNNGAIGCHHLSANSLVNNLDGTSYNLDESLVNAGSADADDDDISEFLIFHKKRDDPKLATECYVKLIKNEIYKQTEVKFVKSSTKIQRRRFTSVAREATFPGDSKIKGRRLIRVVGEGDTKIKHRRLTYPANAFSPQFLKDHRSKAKHTSKNQLPLKPSSRTTRNSSKVSDLALEPSNEEPINRQPKIVLKIKKKSSTWCIVPQNQNQLTDCRVLLERLRTIDSGTVRKRGKRKQEMESDELPLDLSLPKQKKVTPINTPPTSSLIHNVESMELTNMPTVDFSKSESVSDQKVNADTNCNDVNSDDDDNRSVSSVLSIFASDMESSPDRHKSKAVNEVVSDTKKYRIPKKSIAQTAEDRMIEAIFAETMKNSPKMLSPIPDTPERRRTKMTGNKLQRKYVGVGPSLKVAAKIIENTITGPTLKLGSKEIKTTETRKPIRFDDKELEHNPSSSAGKSCNRTASTQPMVNISSQMSRDTMSSYRLATNTVFHHPCRNYLSNQPCRNPMKCQYSHILPQCQKVLSKMKTFMPEKIEFMYKNFISNYQHAFEQYFPMMCQLFAIKQMTNTFATLVGDCEKYARFDFFRDIFDGLVKCNKSNEDALELIVDEIKICNDEKNHSSNRS